MSQRADSPGYRAMRVEQLTMAMCEGLRLIYATGDQLIGMIGPEETNAIWRKACKDVAAGF